jgi:putative membrane protein
MENDRKGLIKRDWLAIERTKLANERTFLSYFRTGIVFLGTGVSVLYLELFHQIREFGVILLVISPVVLFFGLWRFRKVRNRIRSYYVNDSTNSGVD